MPESHPFDGEVVNVLRDPSGLAVQALDSLAQAMEAASLRGPGWAPDRVFFGALTDEERRRIGGCRACRRGPCSIALMPGEECMCGCGCHGLEDEAP